MALLLCLVCFRDLVNGFTVFFLLPCRALNCIRFILHVPGGILGDCPLGNFSALYMHSILWSIILTTKNKASRPLPEPATETNRNAAAVV